MKLFTPIFLILSLVLCGCSSVVSVDHSFDPNHDLSEYRSFAFLPIPHSKLDENAMAILGEDDLSLVALQAVLEEKGFEYLEEGTPDFMVGLRVEMGYEKPAKVAGAAVVGSGFNFSVSESEGVSRSQQYDPNPNINEGINGSKSHRRNRKTFVSMSVEVFDTVTKEMVWKGWATAPSMEVFSSGSAKLRIVNQIMQRFPN